MTSTVEDENTRATTARSHFVGRERELSELRDGLADATSGRGRLGGVFLISGEPGIGKTRLADELAVEAASRGMRVVWGRCWEGGGAPAYLPWVDVLRSLILHEPRNRERHSALAPEIAQLIPELSPETASPRLQSDPEQARFRLFDAVATLLKQLARSVPLLIILDDLHEADHSSLELLKFVARGLTDSHIVIVGTHRDAEVRRSPHLSETIGEILRYGHAITLAGLDQNEVTRIIEQRAQRLPSPVFAAELHRVTQGNPLFVDGVVRVLLAERKLGTSDRIDLRGFKLPEDVRGAIRKRLGLLSAQAQSVLAIAAVLGQEFDPALLDRIGNLSAEATAQVMDEASEMGLVVHASRDSCRFTHPLIRESLYKGSPEAERTRLHRAIGEFLENTHTENLAPHLAALAHHFREAGVVDKAIDYSIRAGRAAQTLYAYDDAISQFEAALALIERHNTDLKKRADLLRRLGSLLQQTDTQRGIEQLEAAAAAYDELNLPYEAALLRLKLGRILASPGQRRDTDQALMHLRKAAPVLNQGAPKRELVGLYYGLGEVTDQKGRMREALSSFTRAKEVAEQLGDDDNACSSTARLAFQMVCAGRISEGLSLLDVAWDKLPAIKDPASLFGTVWSAGSSNQFLWDWRSAGEWYKKGLASQLPSKYQRDVMRVQMANLYWSLGEIAQSYEQLADWQSFDESLLLTAEDLFARVEGDLVRSRRLQEAQLEPKDTKSGGFGTRFGTYRALASTLRESGDSAKAEEILQSPFALFEGAEPLLQMEMVVRPERAINLTALGKLDAAQAEIRRCADILAVGEDWRGLAGHYHRAAAFCAATSGNEKDGEHHFMAALGVFSRMELPWFRADTFRLWGQALVHTGQPRSAQQKFESAIETYRRIGAGQRWIDRTLAQKARALAGSSAEQRSNAVSKCIFQRDGEYWTTAYEGDSAKVRDRGGMLFIAQLLGRPGENISAIEMFTAIGATAGTSLQQDGLRGAADLGDAGEKFDALALSSYRRRIAELENEIDNADASRDFDAAARARAERDALVQEIASGTNLHGGLRRAASHRERARVNVTRQIKSAIESIRKVNPALGRHLANSIYTGSSCRYAPADRIKWQL